MLRNQTTRRNLLKGAAAAAGAMAFPSIVPSTVFGQNAPSNRVNLAAIGCGGRGTDNCRHSILPIENARIIAAVDPWQNHRERFAKMANDKYGGDVCKPISDFREVLSRTDIDGVIVSTPDHWHVPIACYAAVAKKDMYVEKPLGVAMAWAWKLRDIIQKNQVVFQYGTQQRGDQRQFRRACELVRNGYIGKVQRVDAWCDDMSTQFGSASEKPYGSTKPSEPPKDLDYDLWVGPAPMKPCTADRVTCFGIYHIYDYALGFIAGWGAHPLDIAQWGLDMDNSGPVRYTGTGIIPPKGSLWDSIESWDVACEYANGVQMRFMSHRIAEPVVKKYHYVWRTHGTTFHGDKGWVSVDRSGLYCSDKALQTYQPKESDLRLYETQSQARNFVECMKTRKPTINPLESAIRSDTISHLSDICIRTGRPIQWDPAKEQIVGDAEAAKMLDRPIRAPWKLG